MGDSKSTTATQDFNNTWGNTSTSPWSAQQPYLTGAFQDAQNNYNTQVAQGPYQGNYFSPTNNNQYSAANGAYNTAMGSGTQANNGVLSQANGLISQGNNTTAGAISNLGSLASGNTASNLSANAKTIASGFNVQDQVNNAMQAANQNASENTIPNLYRAAAGSGNLNSDRTALAQGVVDRGLQQTATNLAGQFENQNYQTGLTSAATQTGQNMGAQTNLGTLGNSLGTSGLGGLSTYINNAGALDTQAQTGADKVQSLGQTGLNNSIATYQANQQAPWTALSNLMGTVGSNSWGSQGTNDQHTANYGTSSTTTQPSVASQLGGALGAVGSLGGSGGLGSFGSFLGSLKGLT